MAFLQDGLVRLFQLLNDPNSNRLGFVFATQVAKLGTSQGSYASETIPQFKGLLGRYSISSLSLKSSLCLVLFVPTVYKAGIDHNTADELTEEVKMY